MMIKEKDRILFMKYALPCAGTLIKRGVVDRNSIESLIDAVKKGKEIPIGAENIFKVAMSACSLIAIDKKKDFIDEEIIRDYFVFRHDDVVDRRFEEMKDFDPEACRVRIGKVVSVHDGFAVVKNDSMIKKFRTDFLPDVKVGDSVITHWDFIVEREK